LAYASKFGGFFFCALTLLGGAPGYAYEGQPETAEDFLERARDHFDRRRFLNALDSLRVTLQMSENLDARIYAPKREAEILAAECLKELGRVDEAANMYERSDRHGISDKRTLSYLALYFDRRKDPNRALEYFERYYALDKTDVATHIRYAASIGQSGNRKRAREILEGIEPKPSGKKSDECELLESQRKYRAATECFQSVLIGRPDSVKNFLALFRLAGLLKLRPTQKEYAQYLHRIFGDEARYIWPLAELYLAEKKFYQARLLLEEIIALDANQLDAKRLLANLVSVAPQALRKPDKASQKEMHLLAE